jgi:hypothetical protein
MSRMRGQLRCDDRGGDVSQGIPFVTNGSSKVVRRACAVCHVHDRPSVQFVTEREQLRHEEDLLRSTRLVRLAGRAALSRTKGALRALGSACRGEHRVDVRLLATEEPRRFDRLAVADQEGRADGHVAHADRLERDVERARRIAVPVRQERHVDPKRLRPRAVRPRRVARDREWPDACRSQVVTPVTQEVQLVRSARRPVEEVEAEERQAVAEHLVERLRLLADVRPDLDVGNRCASFEHAASLVAPVAHKH